MKVTLNQEELSHAVISYLVNKGYEVDDNSLIFEGDEYEELENLECVVQVIKEPGHES